MRALAWRTLPAADSPAGMVKGTELARAVVPDTLHRFVVYEVRAYQADRTPDAIFTVRDAGAIGDDEVRTGKRPPVVRTDEDCDRLVAWCLAQT